MRFCALVLCCLMLIGCSCNCHHSKYEPQPKYYQETYSVPRYYEAEYTPASGQVFHAAGFDIKEGQQMRRFFSDFEEPMHTAYHDNTVVWTYYVDYNSIDGQGKIVRYADLNNYGPHSLCTMKVTFYYTYVSNATSTCR